MRRRHVKFVYIQIGGCGLKCATFYLKIVQLFYAKLGISFHMKK